MTQELRIAQATAWYPPRQLGGTEVYVAGLVRELQHFGANSFVLTPDEQGLSSNAGSEVSPLFTYPVPAIPTEMELRRLEPHSGFDTFRAILSAQSPQIYHQHSWTRGLGKFHLQAAHNAGLKTVMTIHVANFLCLRGTMMRFGKSACNGLIAAEDCSACWSQQRGASAPLSQIVAATPPQLGRFLIARHGVFGRLGTLMATSHLVEEKRRELLEAAAYSDRIVAVCQWLYDALILNGVPERKLVLCRHGVDLDSTNFPDHRTQEVDRTEGPRFVFLGRSDPIKGAHILVEAAVRIPVHVKFQLDLYCVGSKRAAEQYKAKLLRLANGDKRIAIRDAVPHDRVEATLASADVLVVPSICLETGPMVALEAKAIGLKVLGSKLGGIAEIIDVPDDGMLVEAGDVAAWTSAISDIACRLATEDRRMPRPASRSMRNVAAEMASLYRELV